MPRKTKDAPGRATPKGGPPKRTGSRAAAGTGSGSGRYTPPVPKQYRTSAPWWPYLIVGFFVAGVLLILLNYLGILGHTSNVYLFVGLGLIVCGFISATRWH
jgi:Cell division protein CrgA